jgi:starch-binding outer membrane protein, SusD/RagB family
MHMNHYKIVLRSGVVLNMLCIIMLFTCCNKLLDPGTPPEKVVGSQVYSNDSLAEAAVKGIYASMMLNFGLCNGYMSRYTGMSADELSRTVAIAPDVEFLNNSLNTDNTIARTGWSTAYNYIYVANDIINALPNSPSVTAAIRNQLTGEACFLRAMTYFYLVNLFGDVPLVLTTDYTKSAVIPRTSVNLVYDQIIADLKQAQNLLTNEYATTPDFPNDKVRANKLAATALLARVYLYREQWANAETTATEVIQSGLYQLEPNLQQTFLNTSKEAILQFMPVNEAFNTAEGAWFVPYTPTGKPQMILTDSLLTSIEPGDARTGWIRKVTINSITFSSPYKYKLNTGTPRIEYNMVLRLAEQFCIRAEALAMQNKLPEAISDLNTIRQRALLPDLPVLPTQAQVLKAIEQERRIELFAEWGHRWFDLKRWPARVNNTTNKTRLDEVMSELRPATWKSTAALWPIPAFELSRNPFLNQNPGY